MPAETASDRMAFVDVMSTGHIEELITGHVYTHGVIDAITDSYYPDMDGLHTESDAWTPRSRALASSLLRCVSTHPPCPIVVFT